MSLLGTRDILQFVRMKRANATGSWSWPSFLRWPAFLIANAVLLLLVGVSTLRETYQGWTVDHQIQALQAQADSLEGKKMELVRLTDNLASPDYVDVEARRRMGWKKPGERVVVLAGYTAGAASSTASQVAVHASTPEESNPQKWWGYFFGK